MIDSYKLARAALDAMRAQQARSRGAFDSELVTAISKAIAPLLAEMVAPPAPRQRSAPRQWPDEEPPRELVNFTGGEYTLSDGGGSAGVTE